MNIILSIKARYLSLRFKRLSRTPEGRETIRKYNEDVLTTIKSYCGKGDKELDSLYDYIEEVNKLLK